MLRIVSRRCVRGLAAALGGAGGPAVPIPGIPVTSPSALSLGSSLSTATASGSQFESFYLIRQASSEASAACNVSHSLSSDEVAETEEVLFVVDRLLGEGDAESALETLEAGVKHLTERFGADARGLMPIYGQLALLHYASGDYPAALEAAQRCYAAAVQRDGEGAPSTLPHAVRYGVMLLASGDPDGALPLLQHSACQLERQVQRLGAAAGALQLRQRHEIGQLQDLMSDLFESTVALAEATYYRALARIARITRDNSASCGGEQGEGQGLSQFHHQGGPHPGDSLHAAVPVHGGNPGATPSCCTMHRQAGSEQPEGGGASGSQGTSAAGFDSREVPSGRGSAAARGSASGSSSGSSSASASGSGGSNGSGCREVVLLAEGGLVEGLLMLRHSLEADHLIVGAALREHSRLVRRTAERGQQAAYIELALQNKRLHDTMRAALLDCFATTDEDE